MKQVLSREEVIALLQGMAAAEREIKPRRARTAKKRVTEVPQGSKGPRVRFRKHLVISLG